jgi:hypothetical protein
MNAPTHILQTLLTNCTKLAIIVCFLFGLSFVQAQTAGLSYQAVIYNNENEAVASQSARLKFTILDSSDGTELYREMIDANTDHNGMVTATIGTATYKANDFKSLSWDGTPKTLKVEMSIDGGSSFHELSEQEILYLPQVVDSSTGQTTQPTSLGVCTGLNYE